MPGKLKNDRRYEIVELLRSMNILVVSQFYYPEPFRVSDICEELVARGHRVTVLTALPNYPEGEIYEGYKNKDKLDEIVNGVHVLRCNCRARHKGVLALGLSYISYAMKASAKVKTLKAEYDVIYLYQLSPVLMGLPAIRAKKLFHIPLYLYCLDIWPESIRDIFKSDSSLFYIAVLKLSRYIYRSADMIGVTSNSFISYLETICRVERKRIHYLPQHAEELYLSMDLSTRNNGIIDFMFLGTISKSQQLETVIEAVSLMNSQLPFLIHLVGTGAALEDIQKLVKTDKLESKVIFHGHHPLKEMLDYYRLADVCLLTLADDNGIGMTVPGKLQGYMAAGKPVIAAINGAAAEVIDKSGCGKRVPSGNAQALARLMTDFILHQEKYANCGQAGREYFLTHYTKKRFIDHLEKRLENLVV